MRVSLRPLPTSVLAAVLAAAALTAGADGTITTTGATIEAGFAPARGTLTIDAGASPVTAPTVPAIDPLGLIGAISGGIPAFVAAGGATPFVSGIPTQTMPGGTYPYSTFNVPQGSTLTFTGAVVIQTASDVQIDGQVTTTTPGASVTFVCGNNFRVISHAGGVQTGVVTTGLGSPISVDAQGTISTTSADASTSAIDAASGPVTLISHGVGGLQTLTATTVRCRSAGNTLVQSAGGVALPTAGTVRADMGDVTVQAYSGAVLLQGATLTAGNNLLVEAAGPVNATLASALSGMNLVTVTAFGGDLTIAGGSTVTQTGGTGDVAVAASGAVNVTGASSVLETGTGDLGMTAFGSGLVLEGPGASAGSTIRNFSARDVSLRAAFGVFVGGTSQVTCDAGNMTLRALQGSITLLGNSSVNAPLGSIDARAELALVASPDAAVSPALFPSLAAQAFLLRGGDAGISLDANPLIAQAGALSLVSSGDVDVNTDLTANGTLTIVSTAGNVDVSGRTITTGSTGARTGDVVVECYGGATATIDATDAVVRSGDDVAESGDVTVKVYAPAAVASRGSLVPREVKVRLRKRDLTRSQLTARGVIDTGPEAIDLSGAAGLNIGFRGYPVSLAPDAAGRLSYRDDQVSIRLTPSKVGSSRMAFTLNVTDDFRGMLDDSATGEITFLLVHGPKAFQGTVRVSDGTFVRSRRRAALVQPPLFVARAHAVLKGDGKDKLDLVAGFATDGTTPNSAPAVTVAFGGTFSVTFPATSFKRRHDGAFTASDAGSGASIVVDYRKETVTFRARSATLGPLPPGLVIQVRAAVTLGLDARAADIRMAHRGVALIY